jgi:hypothetical protein
MWSSMHYFRPAPHLNVRESRCTHDVVDFNLDYVAADNRHWEQPAAYTETGEKPWTVGCVYANIRTRGRAMHKQVEVVYVRTDS